MVNEEVIKAIAKVMIAAAWADGEISNEELNSLKDLLFQIPEMTARDWAELDIYMETPVGELERLRLVEDLRSKLSTPQVKALALTALNEVVNADGRVSDSERILVDEIRPMIEAADVGMFGSLSRLMQGSLSRRSQVVNEAPNREVHLDDFINNKIFYMVGQHLKEEYAEIDVPEEQLRKLSLAGGLMARVAYVDRQVSQEEFDALAEILELKWGIPPLEAALVVEVAVSEIGKGLDDYRLSREFFQATSEGERIRFLDVLFAMAASDGFVSYEETEEIRLISKILKMTHKQFIDAKLTIPRELRSD